MNIEFVAIAMSEYDHHVPLPKAQSAVEDITSLFREAGFTIKHDDLNAAGDKLDIGRKLDDWFREVKGGTVILYWAGHGVVESDHYLVCKSSPKYGLTAFNAVKSEAIGDAIAKSRAEKVLVVIDTCHAGAGTGEIASSFTKVLSSRPPIGGHLPSISVIASSHSLEKAMDGTFSSLFWEILGKPDAPRDWSDGDEFLDAVTIARCIARLLNDRNQITIDCKDSGLERRFIPNPRFRRIVGVEDVETRRQLEAALDGIQHFELASKGLEVGETGCYFTGRWRLLSTLVEWLASAASGLTIVTGPPGSGKSAIIGRLVTLSMEEHRNTAKNNDTIANVPESTLPLVGCIDIAIHTKGKSLNDVLKILADALSLGIKDQTSIDPDFLVKQVGELNRSIAIVFDALDEAFAGQSRQIASNLIVPLAKLRFVKVLIGVRRSLDGAVVPIQEDRHGRLHSIFGARAIIHDLDDETETDEDIAAYVRQRLAFSNNHQSNIEGVRKAAEAVATQADGIFLYARVVSRTLQEQKSLDTRQLPEGAIGAFVADLRQRFASHETRVDELLGALAFGMGRGLSRKAWAPVATALSRTGSVYSDADITWVVNNAGWHIVEQSEETNGVTQAVYRLVHQAFSDHYQGELQSRMKLSDAHRRITKTLAKGIIGAEWLDADRYLWRHLADHASMGDVLGDFINIPAYLAIAAPSRLIRVLHTIQDEEMAPYKDIYRWCIDQLIDRDPLERMPILHLMAQIERPYLASELEPVVETPWQCVWAKGNPSQPHQIIGRHDATVTSVALGAVRGQPIIVSASEDGTVRRWDARTSEPIGPPLSDHDDYVTSVAIGVIAGEPAIISGSHDKTVRRWSLESGEPLGRPIRVPEREVCSVDFATINGQGVIISAGQNGGLAAKIQLWDAETGSPIRKPLEGHKTGIYSVAFITLNGRLEIVSGGVDRAILRWDPETGSLLKQQLESHGESILSIAGTTVEKQSVIISSSHDGSINRWDSETGALIGHKIGGHDGTVNSVSTGTVAGKNIIISGGNDRQILRWDAESGSPIGSPLIGHEGMVESVKFDMFDGRSVILSGSSDSTIRLWDADIEKPPLFQPACHSRYVSAIVLGELNGQSLLFSASHDHTIRRWHAGEGHHFGDPILCNGSASCIVFGTLDGRATIFAVTHSSSIVRCDVETGRVIGRPFEGSNKWVNSIALCTIKSRLAVIAGFYDGTIGRWDAKTGSPIGAPVPGHKGGVEALAVSEINGRKVILSAGRYGTIQCWEAETNDAVDTLLHDYQAEILDMVIGHVDGRTVIFSGGRDNIIHRLDAETGDVIGVPLEGHRNWIRSLAFGVQSGRAVVLSTSNDNSIRRWDAKTGELLDVIETREQPNEIIIDELGQTFVTLGSSLCCIEFKSRL